MLNPFATRHPDQSTYFVIYSIPVVEIVALLAVAIFVAVAPLSWVLIALAAATGTILALVYPWLAWLGLAFALPIASGTRIGPASLTDLLLTASLALWCASAILPSHNQNRQNSQYKLSPLPIWAIAIYILTLYLSALGASDLDEALTEMVKWIEFAALLWIVPMALSAKHIAWLVAALLAAAALQGIYGLYQFIFRIGPDWFLIQGRFMRASGVFAQPNPYGAYLGLSLPVAFSLSLWGVTSLVKKWDIATLLWTIFYAAATLAIGVGLVASWSRGGWLGAIGGVIVVLAFFDRRTALLLGLGILILITTALVGAISPGWIPTAISGRLGDIPAYLGFVDVLTLEVNDDNFAIVERVAHWFAALRMWESSPWLGVGPGNYSAAYATFALPRWNDALGHAHNIYLNVLGETGILGLGAFLLQWSMLIGWLLQQMRRTLPPHSWARALATGVLGVLAHLAIHSFFDNLFVQGMYLHVALWLATVATAVATTGTASANIPSLLASSAHRSESDG